MHPKPKLTFRNGGKYQIMRNGCTVNSSWNLQIHLGILVCYLTLMENFSKRKNVLSNKVIMHILQYQTIFLTLEQCPVFETYVHSILFYACEFWGFHWLLKRCTLIFTRKQFWISSSKVWCHLLQVHERVSCISIW